MTIIQSIILGIIQGITEFLPISSSAHLVLVPYLLGWRIPEEQVFPFDVLVQLGTLLAVIYYFRKELKEIVVCMLQGVIYKKPFDDPASRTGWFVLLASIPAGLIGLFFKSRIEEAFQQPAFTAVLLIGTAIMLVIAEIAGKQSRDIETMTWLDALWIGIFQVFALFPGISRSGSTITGAMTRGLKRKPAGQFSFLMAIPIMLAASLLGALDLIKLSNLKAFGPVMLVGFISAAVIGYFSIHWLIAFISKHSLMPFAIYCTLLGIGSLFFTWFSPTGSLFISSIQDNEAIHVDFDPELTWLLPIMNACSQEPNGFNWIGSGDSKDPSLFTGQNLSIQLEEPVGDEHFHFLIGSVPIFPVVNTENQLESLTISNLQNIFTGQITSWQDLFLACPDCFQNRQISPDFALSPIALWIEPPESKLNQKILESLGFENSQPAYATYAPNNQALAQSIIDNSAIIGFLPAPSFNDQIKKISLPQSNPWSDEAKLSIFATIQNEPTQQINDWLFCIQEELKTYQF